MLQAGPLDDRCLPQLAESRLERHPGGDAKTAGFIVADVRTLDKQQGSYRQVTSTAVKQDLVISAYRPNGGLEERFELEAGTEDGVWDFVRTHLRQLPVFTASQGRDVVRRSPSGWTYLLFDRMVAFHVQRGVAVPLSAPEFYAGSFASAFRSADEIFFLEDQVAEYEAHLPVRPRDPASCHSLSSRR